MKNMSKNLYLIIFCDLVKSSEVATELSLEEYARYVQSFYFAGFSALNFANQIGWKDESHLVEVDYTGDELLVMKKINDINNDIFTSLAFVYTFKLYWLLSAYTVKKVLNRRLPREISFGLHIGELAKVGNSSKYVSYDINIAKRVEGVSREGLSSNIYVTKYIAEVFSRWRRSHIQKYKDDVKMTRVISCTDFTTAEAKRLEGISGQVYVCEAIPRFDEEIPQKIFQAINEKNEEYRSYKGLLDCIANLAYNFKSNEWRDEKHSFFAADGTLNVSIIQEYCENIGFLSRSSANRWFNIDTFYIMATFPHFINCLSSSEKERFDFPTDHEDLFRKLA